MRKHLSKAERSSNMCDMRIGHGYDVHRFKEGRKLIIGGIDIPFDLGLDGHSDADVLIHSVCDALIGAMALGDIVKHFPDTDPKYKDADSMVLLRHVIQKVNENGYRINNIDSNIIAQNPKMLPYIPKMKEALAVLL